MKRLALLVAFAAPLGACGLHPLYEGGGAGPVAASLARVEVAAIPGKAGYLMSNALRDRLPERSDEPALYRLEIKLDDSITGLGVRRDDTITRERRSLRARYQLVDNATGEVVLDATAGSDAGVDVVNSEYATIAAENTALENLSNIVADQIVARIATYTRRTANAAGAPGAPDKAK
jgi:LPS-assembly lipoprotein